MTFFYIFIFCLNVVLLFVISGQIKKMQAIGRQYKVIQENIDLLVKENTRVVNVLLEEMESRVVQAGENTDMSAQLLKNQKGPDTEPGMADQRKPEERIIPQIINEERRTDDDRTREQMIRDWRIYAEEQQYAEQRRPDRYSKREQTAPERKEGLSSFRQGNGSKIIYLRQQGLSVQEIAEQLSVPQGEISLKLNLLEKTMQR